MDDRPGEKDRASRGCYREQHCVLAVMPVEQRLPRPRDDEQRIGDADAQTE